MRVRALVNKLTDFLPNWQTITKFSREKTVRAKIQAPHYLADTDNEFQPCAAHRRVEVQQRSFSDLG